MYGGHPTDWWHPGLVQKFKHSKRKKAEKSGVLHRYWSPQHRKDLHEPLRQGGSRYHQRTTLTTLSSYCSHQKGVIGVWEHLLPGTRTASPYQVSSSWEGYGPNISKWSTSLYVVSWSAWKCIHDSWTTLHNASHNPTSTPNHYYSAPLWLFYILFFGLSWTRLNRITYCSCSWCGCKAAASKDVITPVVAQINTFDTLLKISLIYHSFKRVTIHFWHRRILLLSFASAQRGGPVWPR